MDIPTTNRAVVATASGPVDVLTDVELDVPIPGPRDLLVEVRAVSVNPVDVKLRGGALPGGDGPQVLGYDGAGVVRAVGAEVTAYAVGDEVYYAGSIQRPGSDQQFQLVDERVAGRKPVSLDFAEAAALPLTTITAWETLFERWRLSADSTGTLLVMGAAGGVGSILVQLARQLTDLTVIAAVGRPESGDWVRGLGAHHVVDRNALEAEVAALAPRGVDLVFSPFSAGMVEIYSRVMGVGGSVVAIDEPEGQDTLPLKWKSQGWHWEFMFTRVIHDPESTAHRELLDEVARLVDAGTLRTTLTTRLSPIDAATLQEAHRLLESSATIGKVVLAAG
ncbi:zinc-binding alcohol dehydrogenase family protein [Modestobacter muralis]|uniref:Zinc-type alcohol dehydrogenase-like protein n=1 Tax=Modestobacter muralis TaxID=1608614 RepID=A0A6P0EQQ4_9ACTN|nr:zinc-binding alcohol dehydrogenase family protein [Modestobacter muralis]NEK92759.1 zinc-binding alcohol dehydrogenase family protein [Modestobacter muralis]NEN49526.1 zinc-binding alcohol dehydrogenase family protein [Modestobacter muralis]